MVSPTMRPQPTIRLVRLRGPTARLGTASAPTRRSLPRTWCAHISTPTRPTVSFNSSPASAVHTRGRNYVSERTSTWLRHEAKLFLRYLTITVVGTICVYTIYYFYLDEKVEREYPTPHEWDYQERRLLRMANKWTNPEYTSVSWSRTFQYARSLCLAFEDINRDGKSIPRLHEREDPDDEIPWEFIPHDISGKSEEWRRGYFEALMLTARGAGIVDGWLKEKNNPKSHVWAPHYIIGPSNPRPHPIPPKAPPAPREEDCEVAFPRADRFYLKILATKGLTPRQRMQAALEYGNFLDTKRNSEGSEEAYGMALIEATRDMDPSQLPYDPKTLVLKNTGSAPSENILDTITALANHKARTGDADNALPIYVSLLRARRALSDRPPPKPASDKPKVSLREKIFKLVQQPDYPPPPPDGTQPPWRSPEERCVEASLNIYIGEILYSRSSHEDGVAWTREGVDESEEQLRALASDPKVKKFSDPAVERCRECLKTGLGNWSIMASNLASLEKSKTEEKGKSSVLSLWGSAETPAAADGRWDAETAVVKERVKRTVDLVENLSPTKRGLMDYAKA